MGRFVIEEMSQTMMRRFCHLQQLAGKAPPECNGPVEKIIQHKVGGVFEVDEQTYKALLKYYQTQEPSWKDYRILPHPMDARVLGPYAREVVGLKGQRGSGFSKKSPNHMVRIDLDGKKNGELSYIS